MAAEERLWLKNYPKGVPAEIDIEGYTCLVDLINDTLVKFKDRPAFTSIVAGSTKSLTFEEIDDAAADDDEQSEHFSDRRKIVHPTLTQFLTRLRRVNTTDHA